VETKVKELPRKAREGTTRPSSAGPFLLFTWLLLLFFGTMDLVGLLLTKKWNGLIFLGVIAGCITGICLVVKKGYKRGFTIADIVWLGIASFIIGGSLALA